MKIMETTSYFEIILLFMLLLLPFLYESSQVFRYYFKYLIYGVIVSSIAIILIPIFAFRPFNVRNLVWASFFCKRVAILLGIKYNIRGADELSKERACVIVSNHQSSLDILGMFNIWHIMDKCTVVAKREVFYAWPFGLGAWLCGLVFINRVQSGKARQQMEEAMNGLKERKTKLWIFPEGTRRDTGELHPFKKGAFHLAIDSQVPILPVVFSSYNCFLDCKNKNFKHGEVIITTLPPIPTTGMTRDNVNELMEETHRVMSEVLKSSSKEALNLTKDRNVGTKSNIKCISEQLCLLKSTLMFRSTNTGNYANDSRAPTSTLKLINNDDKAINSMINENNPYN